ncbi:MAG TPA: hypothetical protein VL117_00045 [Thermoleophilia bacterium]|nr:hypothetical protein [Thermoleophilia bacterium]
MTDDESGAQSERPLTDQERAEQYREQLKQLHVIDLVRDMMVTLVTVGYEKLGLTDQTRDLRDLTDARVAIESLRRLIEVVEGEGDPESATLRSTLAQMQLNFARASAESRTATAAPHGTASAPPRPAGPASAPPEQTASAGGTPAAASEPSEAEPRSGVETESEAQKAPAAKKAAAATAAPKPAPKKPAPNKAAPKKPAAKKATPGLASEKAPPKKAASSPKRAPRKKPSGGA